MSESQTSSIPNAWVWVQIQDIASTATGGTPSRSVSEYFDGDIPWVKSGELRDGRVFDTEDRLSALGLESSNAKLFPRGTLCIALYGATVGRLGILGIDAATNQAVCGIFLPKEIVSEYFFHYLASIRHHLISQGKGGAQSNISNGLVRQIRVPLAPTNEQRRIVAKIEELFSDLDAAVAALERAKANLKYYRAAVLKAAVEGKLTAEWRAKYPTEPASKLLERILVERRRKWEADQLAKFAAAGKEPPKNWKAKYVEPKMPDTNGLPELPEGWCWASMEQLTVRSEYGTSVKCNYDSDGLAVLRIPNIAAGKIDLADVKYSTLPLQLAPDDGLLPGDMLMCRTNGSISLIGKAAVVRGELPRQYSFASYLLRFRFSPPASLPLWVHTFVSSLPGKRFIETNAASSAGQHNISLSLINRMPVPLSPDREQVSVLEEIEERLSVTAVAEQQIDVALLRAARLRQSILKQAFEGKLVPQDPSDEPASELLEWLSASPPAHEGAGKTAAPSRTRSRPVKSKSGRIA